MTSIMITMILAAACLPMVVSQATSAPTSSSQTLTLISAIQGSLAESPLVNSVVTVSAIVVGDFQTGDADDSRNTGGFYLQEEDSDSDNNALTSEGIYVYEGSTMMIDVKLGDLVEVTGTVAEYKEQTQISKVTSVKVVSSSNSLPTAAVIVFPKSVVELEAYEAMRVEIDGDMIITDMYNLARYGEISLSKTRGYSYTQQNPPGDPEGYVGYLDEIAKNKITYDDGLTTQNNEISLFGPTFSTATAPRMGDVMTGLAGILEYSFDKWRIRSIFDGQNTVSNVNARTNSPPDVNDGVDGAVKIASLNVLNFFTTLNKGGATTGPSPGGEPRGANSQEEFDRQLEKLVTAIVAINADLLGMLELENDFGAAEGDSCALKTLVDTVNARVGADTYAYVWPGGRYVDPSDVISVGMMYKPAVFTMTGIPGILTDNNLPTGAPPAPIFDGSRASLAASFTHGNECITVAANHFKSKRSGDTGEGDTDILDGAGAWNKKRTNAAKAVVLWMDGAPTGYDCSNKLLLGDLNSYAMEDPITFIKNAGYVSVEETSAYSYVYDGLMGTLDYIFVNPSLASKVIKAGVWHANEDEPDVLDYNLDYKRNPAYFDGQSPARCSDHSPVVLGLNLLSTLTEAPTATPTMAPTLTLTEAPTATSTMAPTKKPIASTSTSKPVAQTQSTNKPVQAKATKKPESKATKAPKQPDAKAAKKNV